MSYQQKVQASWLVNVFLVPVCGFFLGQTYFSLKGIEKGQVEMKVEQARQGERQFSLEVKVNRIERKVDRLDP